VTIADLATQIEREQPEDKIVRHATILSGQLQSLRQRMYPPHAQKALRNFMTQEVSRLTSIPESTLRTMSNDAKGPIPFIV
jgi:chromosome partitioning protein